MTSVPDMATTEPRVLPRRSNQTWSRDPFAGQVRSRSSEGPSGSWTSASSASAITLATLISLVWTTTPYPLTSSISK